MRKSPENSTEFYFDVSSGQLLIGALAVEAHIEAGGQPDDIYPLPELLTGPEKIVGPQAFEPLKYVEWDSRDNALSARWLHNVVSNYSQGKVLSREVIARAGYLNLVPRIDYFKQRAGGLSSLYQEAKLENTRLRSAFDSWATKDFIDYIHRLAEAKGAKPTVEDLKMAGRLSSNPSLRQVGDRFDNNLGVLFELADYASVKNWGREDFINWGVKFMEANDGKLPSVEQMEQLSSKHYGPNPTAIYNRDDFSSILDFQTEVMFAYEEKMQFKKENRTAQVAEIGCILESEPELEVLTDCAKDENDLLRIFARLRLLKHFAPEKDIKAAKLPCTVKGTDRLVRMIVNSAADVTVADIETQAEIMQIYDTIWPMDSYLQDLKVA